MAAALTERAPGTVFAKWSMFRQGRLFYKVTARGKKSVLKRGAVQLGKWERLSSPTEREGPALPCPAQQLLRVPPPPASGRVWLATEVMQG